MNLKELVDQVAKNAGVSKEVAGDVVRATLQAVQGAVADGEKVTVTGFGTFEQVHRPGRDARNPSTGERITVAESWVPKFRPGATFKDLVQAAGQEAARRSGGAA